MKRGQQEFVEKLAKLDNVRLYAKLKRNIMIDMNDLESDDTRDWFDIKLLEEFEQRLKSIGFFNGKNV